MSFPTSYWFSLVCIAWLAVNARCELSQAQIPIVHPATPVGTGIDGGQAPQIPIIKPADTVLVPVVKAPVEQPLIPIETPLQAPNSSVRPASNLPPIVGAATPASSPMIMPVPKSQEGTDQMLPGEFHSFLAPIAVVPQPPATTKPAVNDRELGTAVPRMVVAPTAIERELDSLATPTRTVEREIPRMARATPSEPGRQDYFSPVPMNEMQSGQYLNSCPHCGGAGCASCMGDQWGSHAPWGWNGSNDYGSGDGYGSLENFENCGFVPRASFYGIFDALYWTRTKGSFVGTTFGGLSGFDYDWGIRGTLGGRIDQVTGYELTFLGLVPLEQERQILSPGGGINALFEPAGGLNFGHVSSFFNAVETNQFAETRLYSVELNRVRWGWDIVKTHIGLRYVYFDDSYLLRSRNIANVTGEMEITAKNNLFGPNVGIDLFYDVGRRASFSWFLKAGGYANAQRTSFELTNNGIQFVNNRDSNGRFSGTIDAGVNAHLHLRRNARIRGGYSALYMYKVASATENYPAFVTPLTGLNTDTKSSIFFHGATFGLEFYR